MLVLAAVKFDALIMVDKYLPYHQITASLPISGFVLDAPSNELPHCLPLGNLEKSRQDLARSRTRDTIERVLLT